MDEDEIVNILKAMKPGDVVTINDSLIYFDGEGWEVLIPENGDETDT
jgi:hypothetical protein